MHRDSTCAPGGAKERRRPHADVRLPGLGYDGAMQLASMRLSRRGVFVILLLLSAVALLLPPRWTDPAKHVAQLLVPPQDLLYGAAHRAARSLDRLEPSTDGDSAEQLAEARLELASLSARLQQLQAENEMLRAVRAVSLPPAIPILPAKIVARDVAAWRDSIIVARGSSRGASWHDWVSARFFVDKGHTSNVAEGQPVLARQALIGRVEQVSPYVSRVQLLTDVDAPRIEVRIGSGSGAAMQFVDYPCSIRGGGRQTMLIEGVDYRYIEAASTPSREDGRRRIQPGDLVFSSPGQLGLPGPMLIGKVSRLEEDPKKRLVYNLIVEPMVKLDDLREVYLIPLVPPVTTAMP